MNAAQRDPNQLNMAPDRPVHAEDSAAWAWTVLDHLSEQCAEV